MSLSKYLHLQDVLLPLSLLLFTIWFNSSDNGFRWYKSQSTEQLWNKTLGDANAVLYWGLSLLFAFVDLTEWRFMYGFKIQPTKHVNLKRYLYVAAIVVFNQLTISLPAGWFVRYWHGKHGLRDIFPLPSASETIKHFFICEAIFEVGFYAAHRLFHYGSLYKRFHKIHHENQAPFAVAAAYAHPVEHLFANTIPMLLGPFLLKLHWSTMMLWMTWRIMETLLAHSGYSFPFFPNALFHDYHHFIFNCNFGVNFGVIVMDGLLGTSKSYFQWLSTRPNRIKAQEEIAKSQ